MSGKVNDEYECLRLENQLCFPMYAAARKITAYYTPLLKPYNLTYTQYLTLLVLWEDGDQMVGSICSKLHLDTGTMTPVLKKMENLGYVKRTRSRLDERVVNISLTKAGKDLKDKVKDIPPMIGSEIHLSKEDTEQLYTLLYKFIDYKDE